MFFKKKIIPLKGIARVNKVVASFKAQIADLEQGVIEIDEATNKNLERVEIAEKRLVVLKENVHTENDLLSVSKNLAENLKVNISKLFVQE
jgi:hypothetical protein